ncbi:MAG TPA: hypothetical protein VFU47_01385, partial [Armatimonadota bacterium]|nr:hypothetical protein [Armatimonadota bacterium]
MGEMMRLIKDLDRGFYREVDAQRRADGGRTSFGLLAHQAQARGLAPESQECESREREFCKRFGVQDPYGHYAERVKAYARETWALEMALGELGLKVKGPEADVLGKFFSSTASTILFPTYVESQVVAGLLLTSLVPSLVAQEVTVNSHTAEHLALTESQADRRTARSGEGSPGAELTLKTAERTVRLEKYQAQLTATYE